MISVSDAASLTNKKLNLVVFSSSFIESTNGKRGRGGQAIRAQDSPFRHGGFESRVGQ